MATCQLPCLAVTLKALERICASTSKPLRLPSAINRATRSTSCGPVGPVPPPNGPPSREHMHKRALERLAPAHRRPPQSDTSPRSPLHSHHFDQASRWQPKAQSTFPLKLQAHAITSARSESQKFHGTDLFDADATWIELSQHSQLSSHLLYRLYCESIQFKQQLLSCPTVRLGSSINSWGFRS